MPLRLATKQNIDCRKQTIEAALTPTLNGITPYAGVRNTKWIFGDIQHTTSHTKCMEQLASEVLMAKCLTFSAPQLIHILAETKQLFQNFR